MFEFAHMSAVMEIQIQTKRIEIIFIYVSRDTVCRDQLVIYKNAKNVPIKYLYT